MAKELQLMDGFCKNNKQCTCVIDFIIPSVEMIGILEVQIKTDFGIEF